MIAVNKITRICVYFLTGLISFHILGSEALAAEDTVGWRPVFDLVMRWLNFGIIVFILVIRQKSGKELFIEPTGRGGSRN